MATKKTKTTSVKKTTAKKSVTKKAAVKKTTKKATQKTVAKKTTTNKKKTTTANKDSNTKKLVKARGVECFWTCDGLILENLEMLRDAFAKMSEEDFAHHVKKDKNDFADWVEQVLEDAACAAALRKSRKPHTARTVVVRHLRYYNN